MPNPALQWTAALCAPGMCEVAAAAATELSVRRRRRMDEAAFIAAIQAAPREDGPRLVYADYLDETGNALDAARAESSGPVMSSS